MVGKGTPTVRRPRVEPPFAIILRPTRPLVLVEPVTVVDRFDAIEAALVRVRTGRNVGVEHYVPFARLASTAEKLRPKIQAVVKPWIERHRPPADPSTGRVDAKPYVTPISNTAGIVP